MTFIAWHLLLPFIIVLLLLVFRVAGNHTRVIAILLQTAYLFSALALAVSSDGYAIPHLGSATLEVPYLHLKFSVGGLYYLFSTLVAIVSLFALVSSDRQNHRYNNTLSIRLILLVGLLNLFLAADNVITLYLFWELMIIPLLMLLIYNLPVAAKSILRNLVTSFLVSSSALLFVIIILISRGQSFNVLFTSILGLHSSLPWEELGGMTSIVLISLGVVVLIRFGGFPFQYNYIRVNSFLLDVRSRVGLALFSISGAFFFLKIVTLTQNLTPFVWSVSLICISIGLVVAVAHLLHRGATAVGHGHFWSLNVHLLLLGGITSNSSVIGSALLLYILGIVGFLGLHLIDDALLASKRHDLMEVTSENVNREFMWWLTLFVLLFVGVPTSAIFIGRFFLLSNLFGFSLVIAVFTTIASASLVYYLYTIYRTRSVMARQCDLVWGGYQRVSLGILVLSTVLVTIFPQTIHNIVEQHLLVFIR
ncbi:MAG: hypothetical protein HN353_12645 [Bdellovibrionales bacterium]|jgi:formate hydrogenlyase subunit 3/multisubunit Na+/H+ antiporter MnhD subunit|nr:hypothetical protein [Bdellovibrionales bacterium]MBT3526366.1 hypothetical protein [Bdellovibrionales bacterium]MBT7669348.1 hypothetical protein [Bdellovibrionales bacterium]